jgi:hypothetical protein
MNLAEMREKEASELADKAIEKMKRATSAKEIENLVCRQPDDVAKLMLIKLIRQSE